MAIQDLGLISLYIVSIILSLLFSYILTNKIFKSKRSFVLTLFCIFIWGLCIATGSLLINNIPAIYILAFIGGVLLYIFIFKFTMLQSYLWSCFIVFHMIVLKGVTVGALSLIMKENSYIILKNNNLAMISAIVSQLLYVLVLCLYIKLVNVKESRTFLLNKKQLTNTLICHLTLTIFMLFNSFSFYYNLDLVWISVSQMLVGIILYCVYIIILNYGIKTADLIQHKLRDQKQLETIQTQMRQQNSLLRMTEILNIFKHDYREHMLMIEDHIENKRYESALEEVKHDCLYHLAELPHTTKYSNNIILNSLLIDRQSMCESLNISMNALLYYPLDLNISEKEYHEVISILTDNAIEANAKVPLEKRYLSIKSNVEQQWLSILIENPYEGIILFENNIPVSTYDRDDNDGMGLIYVEELLEERQGIIRFDEDIDNKIFQVTLLIRIDNEESKGDI